MRNSTIFAFIGLGLLTYFILKKGRDISGLLYNLVGVTNFNFTGAPRATLLIQIANPTSSDFPLLSTTISGHVILNGSVVLGNAIAHLDNYLRSGETVVIPVDFEIVNQSIASGIVALAALLTQKGVALDFDGILDIAGFVHPLHLNYVVK